MIIATYPKKADSTSQFGINWADWLGDRVIVSSIWDGPAGITIADDDFTNTVTTITLSGGTWTESYELVNTIETDTSETESRSLLIEIRFDVRYCTVSEFRGSGTAAVITQATESALPDTEVEILIERASRFFDLECGAPAGYFNTPLYPIATAKTFYGDGTAYLKLPPYVPGSLNTTIGVPDGYSAPEFIERDGFLVRASNGIGPIRYWHDYGWWDRVPLTISARWGWDRTPEDVKLAVIELAVNLWRETDPANLKLVNIDNQPLRERVPPRVAEIARRYRGKLL